MYRHINLIYLCRVPRFPHTNYRILIGKEENIIIKYICSSNMGFHLVFRWKMHVNRCSFYRLFFECTMFIEVSAMLCYAMTLAMPLAKAMTECGEDIHIFIKAKHWCTTYIYQLSHGLHRFICLPKCRAIVSAIRHICIVFVRKYVSISINCTYF